MVKIKKILKQKKKQAAAKRAVANMIGRVKNQVRKKPMGPISAIDTAPVAIGNSVKGSSAQIIQSKNGVTVRSRDFMFSALGSGAVQTWTVVGGAPITPAAFSDSTIRQFLQMYQKYRWKYLAVHYITSSSTSSTGDVMFYFNKNRSSVMLNQTSPQLLPFVLNDDDTVIGPQWTNHSTLCHMKGTWKSTDYGMTANLDDYADGDVFLLSKTTTTDSPGYVLFDYEIEFSQLQISPRLLSLPISRIQWDNLRFGQTAIADSAGTFAGFGLVGNDLSGAATAAPSGASNGDIYKVFVDVTNSATGSWVGATPTNIFRINEAGGFLTVPLQDGTTFYAVYNGSNWAFYPNADTAFAQNSNMAFQWNVTATLTWTLLSWVSYVGSVGSTNLNPNF